MINDPTNDFLQIDNKSGLVTKTYIKYNSFDDIIQKYTSNRRIKENNHYLHRNIGNHALFAANLEFSHSTQNCVLKYKENKNVKYKGDINNKINDEIMNHGHRNEFTFNRYEDVPKLSNVEERLTSDEKMYYDKTTYCRPISNYYNEQFIYKTMERNARLKRLVRKLVIARQKEKETVSWNNYINELKNKHEKSDEPRLPVNEPDEYITPEIINDYYNTKFSSVQSRPCKHLLQELYGLNNESQSNYTYYRQLNENIIRQSEAKQYIPHDRNPYCYPTSSQGRLIMLDRERRFKQSLNHWPDNLSDKNVYIKNIGSKRYLDRIANTDDINKENSICNGNISHNRAISVDKSVHTDIKFYPNLIFNKYQDKATYLDDFVTDKYDTYKIIDELKLKEDNQDSNKYLQRISLINIDTKLETLIESINTFIDEIKLNRSRKRKIKDDYIECKNNNKGGNIKMKNDSVNNVGVMKIVDSIVSDISRNTFNVSDLNHNQWSSNINNIQGRNMQKSKSMQICNNFANQPCSVEITFEVPTKDCSTEVTKSLSKQNSYPHNKEVIEEISSPEHMLPLQRMTIAVNTDPLSFLGLLKISTDTFKRLLSFMPNFDYYSYLSLLQLPLSPKRIEPHYVCNICGAEFNKPSKLSDHIRDHNLGKTKDCCVCRHVLDTAKKSSGLFRCRYCGQLFARAYCCELHQESCARRLGRHHDISSSLMLLR